MAEHTLQSRIVLRYGLYTQWMNSNLILKKGEAAIAAFPRDTILEDLSNSEPDHTPPAIGIKIGDGINYFRNLPWVQAIAADVYTWAKSSQKPTYTAQEIQGLESFIESVAGGGGQGTVASRIYQLVEGQDENAHKFYLRYKDNDEVSWHIDTSTAIDLNDLVLIANWIGRYNLTEYPNMLSRTGDQITTRLGNLNHTDTAVENQFVTAVSEESGIISISRARPTFANISGTATVQQGGTGRNIFADGEVLIGNDTGAINTRPIASSIANNNHIVPNYLIKQYVDNAVSGLEGAMHYVGDATVEPRGAVNPQVSDYNFGNALPGDVVLWEQKEYIWTGTTWRLLGDEGSYAIKGSIKDADIDEEANIAQSKIANLSETFNTKVDKVEGKGLSSNDYTDEEKLKLRGIEDGANVNIIEAITLNGNAQTPDQNKTVNLTVNEFDNISRAKLEGIEEGAQVNSIEGITLNGTAQLPDNNTKVIALTVKEFSDEDRRKLNTIEEGAQVNTIETIYLNDKAVSPDQNKRIDLSVREYPKEDEDKLKTIESGAQVNIIEHIKVDNQEIAVDQNKTISITTDPHTEHENIIESISFNGTVIQPDNNKQVNITYTQNDHPEHINVIEEIQLNGTPQAVNNKTVNLILNESTLDVGQITGAQIPSSNNTQDDITIINKKLQLARIADSGNIQDLLQTQDTYIILDCGTSSSDMHPTNE